MGCDGGTIPKRDELVKTKKKPEQKDKASELSFRWQHCAITQQPLQPPVVADEMGRLFSKESVIEALLDKSEENGLRDVAAHLKSLKDVKELALTENPLWINLIRGEAGDSYIDVQKSKWICPVSGMEMNGRFRFCYLWSCGCVFSEKALKEMMKLKEDGNECPKCNKLFKILDIITLNPIEERDIVTLQEKMSLRRILAKEAKDAKKAGKTSKKRSSAAATATSSSSDSNEDSTALVSATSSSSSKLIRSVKDSATAAAAAEDQSPSSSSKRSKIVPPPKAPTAAAASSMKPGTSAYSVAKDPNASEVYKSLFTTHGSEQRQERAHWVTYNPFYN